MPLPDDRFARIAASLVQDPTCDVDLAEAALLVAADLVPELDVAAQRERLDALAEAARGPLRAASSDAERVDALNDFLFEREGFAGNHDDYEDPRNSLLHEVLDRKRGLP